MPGKLNVKEGEDPHNNNHTTARGSSSSLEGSESKATLDFVMQNSLMRLKLIYVK